MKLIAGVLLVLAAPALGGDYEIGPGDVVHVAVLGQPDMTGDFPVDSAGELSFPFVGKIPAAGVPAPELERRITALLADGYIREPRVSVTVKEFRSQRVFVTGEVQRPGPYGLRPEQSLRVLLGDVGDLTAAAGHEVVVVRPPGELPSPSPGDVADPPPPRPPLPDSTGMRRYPGNVPGAEIFHVSLRELRSGNPDKDFRLQPGDTVYFPRAAQIYVTGNVARAGGFRFEEGLTVLQALNLAGGVTDRGSSKGVRIVRIVNGAKREFKAKPADMLEPEDTLVVPERFF